MRPARLGRNLETVGWLVFLCGSAVVGLLVHFGLKHQQELTKQYVQAQDTLLDGWDQVRRSKIATPVPNKHLEELQQIVAAHRERVQTQQDYTLRLQATSLLLMFAGMALVAVGMVVRKKSEAPGELMQHVAHEPPTVDAEV